MSSKRPAKNPTKTPSVRPLINPMETTRINKIFGEILANFSD